MVLRALYIAPREWVIIAQIAQIARATAIFS